MSQKKQSNQSNIIGRATDKVDHFYRRTALRPHYIYLGFNESTELYNLRSSNVVGIHSDGKTFLGMTVVFVNESSHLRVS